MTAAPHPDTALVLQLLHAGKTLDEVEQLTHWPRGSIRTLIGKQHGWLIGGDDRVHNPRHRSGRVDLPHGVQPLPEAATSAAMSEDTSRALALLAAGHAIAQAARIVGWPETAVRTLVAKHPAWRIDGDDTISDRTHPGRRVGLPDGVDPAHFGWATTLLQETTVKDTNATSGGVDGLLAAAATSGDKQVLRELARIKGQINRLRELVSGAAERAAARKEVAELEAKLAAARRRVQALNGTRTRADRADAATVRVWASGQGIDCPGRGRIPDEVRIAYAAAHRGA